ncbi:MAG: biopolymer transporter ExbD [Verrucomicrobiales bacterium]|nr:biopolymer transporter ExbD [Verrucomicrobiales bacterium]
MPSEKLREAATGMDEDLEMDMSPMIDLTFLLLVFFMVSSHLISVQIDRRVKAPIAKNAQVAKDASGRVVVNILADGTVWGLDEIELTSSESITAYIDAARVANEQKTIPTRLNLRADKEVDTRIIKKVVQAAAEAGVVEVIFGSYSVEM